MWRVMIVTNSLSGGGAERSMNLLANELTKRGWPVSLVPINSGKPDQVVPVCSVFPLNRIWNGSFLNTVVAFWNFNKVVNSWKPDIIVLNCDLQGKTILLAKLLRYNGISGVLRKPRRAARGFTSEG